MAQSPPLKNLLLTHELIFLFLIALAGSVGGYGIHLWRSASLESVRISQITEEIQETRGDLYRQMKELFDAQFLADTQAQEEYDGYTLRIQAHFDRLKIMAEGNEELAAIESMQRAYQNFVTETRVLFKIGVSADTASLKKAFDSDLELKIFRHYESVTSAAEKVLADKQKRVLAKLRQADQKAGVLLATPVVLGIFLLLFSRTFLQRSIARPIDRVLRATQEISAGKLQQRVPETGAAELARLASAINQMADELIHSQEALLRSEKQAAQGALVPVLAHNIRNPLASIRATAQVADDPALDADTRESLKGIISTVDRLERWTGALLAYLHPLKPSYMATSLQALVNGAMTPLESKLKEKKVMVMVSGCEGIKLFADIHLLEQAIYNLLLNAMDASPPGSRISVIGSQQQDMVALEIQDQGSGMPFTPEFNTLTPGPSTKRFGTGLGIPFAFKICESHGGELSFTPRTGGGTVVTMKISANPEIASLAL